MKILYTTKLSFKNDAEIKSFQLKMGGVHHQKNCPIRNDSENPLL